MLGKIEGGRRRGWQDEMVGWHHRLNGHEFEQTLGGSEGQGSLMCYSSWGCKESDTTEQPPAPRQAWVLLDRRSPTSVCSLLDKVHFEQTLWNQTYLWIYRSIWRTRRKTLLVQCFPGLWPPEEVLPLKVSRTNKIKPRLSTVKGVNALSGRQRVQPTPCLQHQRWGRNKGDPLPWMNPFSWVTSQYLQGSQCVHSTWFYFIDGSKVLSKHTHLKYKCWIRKPWIYSQVCVWLLWFLLRSFDFSMHLE